MARDIASSFNHLYGDHFTLPEVVIDEQVATLPGLDGRKMSKSYDNTIPLFAPPEQLRKLIAGILTDSKLPGEPKNPEGSPLFQIYQAFATPEETQNFRQAYADGIAWGDAKELLFQRIDREIAPMRDTYEELMAHPEWVEDVLQTGAIKARGIATTVIQKLRRAVGLRSLVLEKASATKATRVRVQLPIFKQYREEGGMFCFKLFTADGRLLIESMGFASPKDCAQAMQRLQAEGSAALEELGLNVTEDLSNDDLDQAMHTLREAKESA
jgi:tryptophanyl-tRNA synthetase